MLPDQQARQLSEQGRILPAKGQPGKCSLVQTQCSWETKAFLGTEVDDVDVGGLYPWWDINNTSMEDSHLGLV